MYSKIHTHPIHYTYNVPTLSVYCRDIIFLYYQHITPNLDYYLIPDR